MYLVHNSILFVDICTTLINKKPSCRLTNGIIDVNNRIQLAKQNEGKQTRHLIGVSSAHTHSTVPIILLLKLRLMGEGIRLSLSLLSYLLTDTFRVNKC